MTEVAYLNKGQKPMPEEKWETHKHCETANRDHKWRWKLDIESGLPHPTQAICVHCGKEETLSRHEVLLKDKW